MKASDCLAARLGRNSRPTGEFGQHPQGFDNGALSHRRPADRPEAALAIQDSAIAGSDREVHQANRLAGRGTSGTSNAGYGNGEIDTGPL